MEVSNKKAEIEETYKTKGIKGEDFVLNSVEPISVGVFGDDLMEVLANSHCYSAENVAGEHKAGDAVFTKANKDGTLDVRKVEIKSAHYPYKNNIPLEIRLLAYLDEKSGNVVPEQDGWFIKRAVASYVFVFIGKNDNPQRTVTVKEEEVWQYYQQNKHKYRQLKMKNAMCVLIPCQEILKNCKSAKEVYYNTALSFEHVADVSKDFPNGIVKVKIQLD